MLYQLLGKPMNLVGESNLYKERFLRKKKKNSRSEVKVNGKATSKSQNFEISG